MTGLFVTGKDDEGHVAAPLDVNVARQRDVEDSINTAARNVARVEEELHTGSINREVAA